MKTFMTMMFSALVLLGGSGVSRAAAQDVKGSKDHPLLSRMANFHITSYKESEFDSHDFVGKDKKRVSIEGRTYYIEYRADAGTPEAGELKLRRNVQDALKKVGGEVIYDDNFSRFSTIVVRKGGAETWVEVSSGSNLYRLYIVERQVMKQEIVANAQAMGSDIGSTGHVSIYGIFFDTGKSDMKPESDAAILEIVKLLTDDGALKLYVVGHTDNVGSFEANMKLSKDRADAVTRLLTGKHGIAAARVKAYGVGSLSPVMSNDSDEGKAKNRRVELVKQ